MHVFNWIKYGIIGEESEKSIIQMIGKFRCWRIKATTEDNALVPKVGLVLLVGELVERLLTQPEGGVQAVDLNT